MHTKRERKIDMKKIKICMKMIYKSIFTSQAYESAEQMKFLLKILDLLFREML